MAKATCYNVHTKQEMIRNNLKLTDPRADEQRIKKSIELRIRKSEV
ncbi:MAG: hypothetical protein ACOX4U_03255 [Anaerovoracaceae bacterium]